MAIDFGHEARADDGRRILVLDDGRAGDDVPGPERTGVPERRVEALDRAVHLEGDRQRRDEGVRRWLARAGSISSAASAGMTPIA